MIPGTIAEMLAARRTAWRDAHEELDLTIARQYGLYHDDAAVEAAGVCGILQMFLFATSEPEHVARFLEFCVFPPGAHILDCGCGTGEFDALIRQQRPDVHITLFNKSLAQLSRCPPERRVRGDMHALPFLEDSFDVMLLCYTLGYGAIGQVFGEAARILRPGGQLVLADMVCIGANQETGAEAILLLLGYKCYGNDRIDAVAAAHGFTWARSASPHCLHPSVVPLWTEHERQLLFRDVWADVTVFEKTGGAGAIS